MKLSFTLTAFIIGSISLNAQPNFRKDFEATDPIAKNDTISIERRMVIHQRFLDRAVEEKNELEQIYGNIYMFYNFLRAQKVVEATPYILEAERIAEESGNKGWQGWVAHRKGILYDILQKEEEQIAAYEQAADLCKVAGDSLCWVESLEQIGANYANLDSFKIAEQYYDRILPIAKKYADEEHYSIMLNNFAILLSRSGQPEKAIPYYQQCIDVNQRTQNYRVAGKAMNNLADAYLRLGDTKKAIDMWKATVAYNQKYGLLESVINNYMGLYVTYDTLKNYRSAYEYLGKFVALKDSLIGMQTQDKIANLEAKYESQQKELALEKSEVALLRTRRTLDRGVAILGIVLLVSIFGLWRWRVQTRQTNLELQRNEEHLKNLTNLLLKKNTALGNLEAQLSNIATHSETIELQKDQENIYNQRILTEEDWAAFKIYFEKTYPGFLLRLRSKHPTLSEAEERLFLFIKLSLTRKEAAAILGISVDSVKRTRNRLRKRLELDKADSLEDYVHKFKY